MPPRRLGSGKGELFPDTVHPNADGAGLIAAEVARVLSGRPASRPATQPAP